MAELPPPQLSGVAGSAAAAAGQGMCFLCGPAGPGHLVPIWAWVELEEFCPSPQELPTQPRLQRAAPGPAAKGSRVSGHLLTQTPLQKSRRGHASHWEPPAWGTASSTCLFMLSLELCHLPCQSLLSGGSWVVHRALLGPASRDGVTREPQRASPLPPSPVDTALVLPAGRGCTHTCSSEAASSQAGSGPYALLPSWRPTPEPTQEPVSMSHGAIRHSCGPPVSSVSSWLSFGSRQASGRSRQLTGVAGPDDVRVSRHRHCPS